MMNVMQDIFDIFFYKLTQPSYSLSYWYHTIVSGRRLVMLPIKTRLHHLFFIYRYGREDEEVMGLKFCNEAVIALQQIWPKPSGVEPEVLSPLQVSVSIDVESNSVYTLLELPPWA